MADDAAPAAGVLRRICPRTDGMRGGPGLEGIREVRISQLCTTQTFRAFVARLILEAPHAAATYNSAQAAYRRRHKVRTRGRPVPPLANQNSEFRIQKSPTRPSSCPFGFSAPMSRAGGFSSRSAVARSSLPRTIGAVAVMSRAVLARGATHAEPWPLERDGWQLRPRALALSAFCRLFLVDLFIHGIGGAKYDEMMEEWICNFLQTGTADVSAGPIAPAPLPARTCDRSVA